MLPHEHYVKVPGQEKRNPALSSKVREGPHIGWLRSRKAIPPVLSGERQLWVKFTPRLIPFFFTFRQSNTEQVSSDWKQNKRSHRTPGCFMSSEVSLCVLVSDFPYQGLKRVLLALKKQISPVLSRLNSSLSFATLLQYWREWSWPCHCAATERWDEHRIPVPPIQRRAH